MNEFVHYLFIFLPAWRSVVDRHRVTRGMTMGQKISGGVIDLSGREGSHSLLGGAKPSKIEVLTR